ncbi:transmembrane emp24 domain-containing protein 11-like [Bolinopsis microptera]|uniref:transmembrane emp24 domain-containing protein 11-like n=1 Tax=Bolinopsis microptera TaxID=2820187 RepID=UPI00307A3488
MTSWYLVSLILSLLLQTTSTLYNRISTWERRCFIEDVPDSTMITYKWSIHLFNEKLDDFDKEPSKDARIYLFISKKKKESTGPNPGSSIVRQQELKNGQGLIHFYAEDYGEYEWCFEMQPSANSEWQISSGHLYVEATRQYQDEEKEKVEDIEDAIINTLSKNLRKVKQIKMEQKYYKEREQEFRTVSYLTSTRVIWYGAVTALTVVSSGCFLMMNLKSFFISKKLV